MENIKIIGLGGIGTILSTQLSRYFNYSPMNVNMTFIDGDSFEVKNFERQSFVDFGNKALSKAAELTESFNKINIFGVDSFVDDSNIESLVKDGDIVLLAVDNHKTRKIVNEYAKELDNIILISGGNEYTDGNVQIYIRKGGKDITPDLASYHPEIENPADKLPSEMSCEELSKSEPQLLFTNMSVATIMCWSVYNILNDSFDNENEIYFDMLSMKADAKKRRIR